MIASSSNLEGRLVTSTVCTSCVCNHCHWCKFHRVNDDVGPTKDGYLTIFSPEAALWSMRPGQPMRVRKRKTTIDMNLGGARFAGETVRRILLQILDHSKQQKHNQARARPATEPRLPPARSPETRARRQHKQTQVIQNKNEQA